MSKGKKNAYRCNTCGQYIITIDVDEGVTPFAIGCRATEGCDGFMYSGFYRAPQYLVPSWEWHKPTTLDGLDPATREHVEKGGLILRMREFDHGQS